MCPIHNAGADGGKVRVSCDRRWSREPRHQYHVISTTPTPMTSPQPPSSVAVTSSSTVRRPVNDDGHVTAGGEDSDWSRPRTLERPPLDLNEGSKLNTEDMKTSWRRQREEDVNTVKHWVKYSDDSAGPTVYRELTDDVDDEYFDEGDNLHEDNPSPSSRDHSSISTY